MSYAHILIRDDRCHDEGETTNLKAYNDEDKAKEDAKTLTGIVEQYEKDWKSAYRNASSDNTAKAAIMREMTAKVIADLNAVIPGAGEGYSIHDCRFYVEGLEIDWTPYTGPDIIEE